MKRLFLPFWPCLLLAIGMLAACSAPIQLQSHSERLYTIDSTLGGDSALTRMLRPYKMGVDTQMHVIVGSADIPLTKAQPECTLGNFMADAQLVAGRRLDPKVDASIMNYGGIRLPYISPGPLQRGTLYELMPFDNMLTIVEIPGDVLQRFCNYIAFLKGWPVAGMSFAIKDKKAENILINGQPLDNHRIYKVVISDYIACGGDNCDFLIPLRKRYTSIFIRDELIGYVEKLAQQGKPLHPQLENRVTYAE